MRKAITILQSAHRLYGNTPSGVEPRHVDDIAGIVPEEKITELFNVLKGGDFQKLQRFVEDVVAEGFAASVILGQVHDELVQVQSSPADILGPLEGVAKAHIMEAIAQADKCLIDGADEMLQLLSVGGFIMRVVHSEGHKAELPKTSVSL